MLSEPVLFRLEGITPDDLIEAIIAGVSIQCADDETLRFFWLLSDYLIEQKEFMEKKVAKLEDKVHLLETKRISEHFEMKSRAVSSGR